MGNRIYIIGNPSSEQSCTLSYSCEIIVKYRVIPVYPELVALIGTTVPDYRGIFLRGHGSQVSTHYGTVTHASASLGELQGDAVRNITGHIIDAVAGGVSGHWGSTDGAFYGGSTTVDGADPSRHGPDYWNIYFDASRVTPVADEIRPINRSVKFLIRAK